MAIEFTAPSFVQPTNYNALPQTLDSVFKTVIQARLADSRLQKDQQDMILQQNQMAQQARVLQGQQNLQNLSLGFDPSMATPENIGLSRKAAPGSQQFQLSQAIDAYVNRQAASQKLLGDKGQASLEQERAQTELFNQQAGAFQRGSVDANGQAGPKVIRGADGRDYQERLDAKGNKVYSVLPPLAEDKPMSAEAAKTSNLAQTGIASIRAIRDIVNKPEEKQKLFSSKNIVGGIGGDFMALASGDTQSQILSDKISEVGDALARLRTGAAITASEEARYGKLLKGRFKTAEAYAEALNTVDKFLQGVDNDLRVGRRKLGGDGSVKSGALNPGDVEDGYRYKGGNKSDPNNWEKL